MDDENAAGSASGPSSGGSRLRAEVGTLRNGLGSIQNLALLLRSIKVGQKALFAAVTAVHADCAAMIASAAALFDGSALPDNRCYRELVGLLTGRLRELDAGLAAIVAAGRLSVPLRLKLERDLARVGADLGATLPLIDLLDAASRPASEPAPVELLHASSADPKDPTCVPTTLILPEALRAHALPVGLCAAKLLIALSVALVRAPAPARPLQLSVSVVGSSALCTTISGVTSDGPTVSLLPLGLVDPSACCAQAAALAMRGRLEYSAEALRACIYWPSA